MRILRILPIRMINNPHSVRYTFPRGVFRGVMGSKPPLDQWNLLISAGFQAPTGAEPPGKIKKNLSPPWKNSWIRPWLSQRHFPKRQLPKYVLALLAQFSTVNWTTACHSSLFFHVLVLNILPRAWWLKERKNVKLTVVVI